MFIYIFMLTASAVIAGEFKVDHGYLRIKGYNNCNYTIGNKTYGINPIQEVSHDGYVLGLIRWNCDNDYGNIIEEIKCKECGIYCVYNQQFNKCRNNWFIPAFGVVLALLVSLIIIFILSIYYREQIDTCVCKIIVKYLTTNDRKRERKVRKLNKMTGMNNPILFRFIYTSSPKINQMIMEQRLALRKQMTGDEPIYEEICHKGEEASKFSQELYKRVIESAHHRRGKAAAYMLTAGLAVQSGLQNVQACDQTLYLSSTGKVCTGTECSAMNAYAIPIQTGSTLCFNTINGGKITIKIYDTATVTRYQALYYTCDFSMSMKTHYECKSVGGECWNSGTCVEGYRHQYVSVSSKDKIYPHGYNCRSDTIGCDTWCWHQTSCVWYSWLIRPVRNKCHMVYHKVSEIWETKVEISYNGITRRLAFNTNNPRYNLNSNDIKGVTDLPLIITGLSHETIHLRNGIINVGNQYYEVDAASLNYPEVNKIGDYQMSLDKSMFTYHNNVRCGVFSCKANCSFTEPSIRRVTESKYGLIPKEQVKNNGEYVIKRHIPISANANLMLGSVQIDSLQVVKSDCKLSIERTIACVGCDIKPQLILRAYDIKVEGLINFESNCSWTSDSLSCNPEPYIIELDQNSDRCIIEIPTVNQTLYADFNYEYTGKLTLLKTYYTESSSDVIGSIVKDGQFWGAIFGTLNMMAVCSVFVVTMVKIAKLGITYKINRDISKA